MALWSILYEVNELSSVCSVFLSFKAQLSNGFNVEFLKCLFQLSHCLPSEMNFFPLFL